MRFIKSLRALSSRSKGFNQRGDTLIEVMLALSVLGIVSVTTMSIMNRSTLQAMDTVERTAVRSDINSQIELLNYTRDHYQSSEAWGQIVARKTTDIAAVNDADKCKPSSSSFYLTQDGDGVKVNTDGIVANNPNGRATPGNGIWIDAVYVSSDPIPYYSFYVKACWTRAGNNHVTASSSTVARIYDSSVPVVIKPAADFTVSNSATSLSTATFTWNAVTCPAGTTFVRHVWTLTSKDPNNGMASRSGTTDQYSRQVPFSTVTPGYYYDFIVKAECKNNSTGVVTVLTGNTVHYGHPFTAQANVPQTPNVGVSPSSGSGNRTLQLNSSCAGTKTNLVFQYRVNGGEWQGPLLSSNGNNYSLTWTPPGKGTYTFEARSQCQTSSLPAGPIDGWTFDSAWTAISPTVNTVVN